MYAFLYALQISKNLSPHHYPVLSSALSFLYLFVDMNFVPTGCGEFICCQIYSKWPNVKNCR